MWWGCMYLKQENVFLHPARAHTFHKHKLEMLSASSALPPFAKCISSTHWHQISGFPTLINYLATQACMHAQSWALMMLLMKPTWAAPFSSWNGDVFKYMAHTLHTSTNSLQRTTNQTFIPHKSVNTTTSTIHVSIRTSDYKRMQSLKENGQMMRWDLFLITNIQQNQKV